MIIILHNIRSLYNVGSIFRTADAVGIEKIYLCGITPKPVDVFGKPRKQLVKVSLGAEKYIEWEHCKSTSRLIDKLKRDGYKIFAIEQDKKSIPYYKIKTTISSDSAILQDSAKKISNIKINSKFRMVLILGNEVKGLPKSILKKSDKILEIPMKGVMVRQAHHPHHIGHGKESLNVAVAFGIIAFHFADYHQ